MNTFDDHSTVTTVFAARMLLEEAARFTWMTQDLHDEEAFVRRSTQYFDEFRKKQNAIAAFASIGVALAAATRLLKTPDNVVEGPETIIKGRQPLPSIDKMLLLMGTPYPEPGWLPVT